MANYTTEILLNKPANLVYDVLSDLDATKKWMQGLQEATLVSGEVGKAGTTIDYTFLERGKEVLFSETVITVIKNKKIASNLESKHVRIRIIIDLVSLSPDRTKIKIYNDVKGKTFGMKLMLPFFKGMMKKRQLEDFNRFKKILEG